MLKSRKSHHSGFSYIDSFQLQLATLDSRKGNNNLKINQYQSIYRQNSINDKLIYQRKQNHLNSHYNRRKQNLKEITKANHKIYVRINSQKSKYDQKKFISYKRPSSRCSSKSSRVSNRSNSSRVSVQQKQKQNRKQCKQSQITINSSSINQLKQNKLLEFANLFNKERAKPVRDNFHIRNRSVVVKPHKKNKSCFYMGSLLHRIQEEIQDFKPKKRII